jgi:hypothetical protein
MKCIISIAKRNNKSDNNRKKRRNSETDANLYKLYLHFLLDDLPLSIILQL